MPSVNCSFCDHANPADAKFCNECGAGLGLRPCAQCEAINDVAATFCHQCGTLLGAAATAVASAANVEGAHTASSSPLMRSQPSGASATDTAAAASLPEVGAGKTAFASPRELASAAERLDAFWRDSMQAVEVARAMKGDVTPPPPRAVDMLPLRVVDDTPVIDAGPDTGAVLRRGPRLAIAAALLVVAAGVVYYGYERTSVRSAESMPTSAVIAAPTTAAPVIAPSTEAAVSPSTEPAAIAAQATPQPPAANALTATSPSVSGDPGTPSPGAVKGATAAPPQPSLPRDAEVTEPAASPRDESTATAARTGAPTTAAAPETATTTDSSVAVTAPTASNAQQQVDRGSGANATGSPAVPALRAPARSRSSTSRTATPRYAVPRQRLPMPSVIAAPPPVARTPVAPAPATSCTDSTAALGLCSR